MVRFFSFLQKTVRHIGFLHLFPESPAGLAKSKDLLNWGRIWTAGTPAPDNVPTRLTFPCARKDQLDAAPQIVNEVDVFSMSMFAPKQFILWNLSF